MRLNLRHTLAILLLPLVLASCRVSAPEVPDSRPSYRVGLRASPYGAQELFSRSEYWVRSTRAYSSTIPGSRPAVIWILGTMAATGAFEPDGEPVFNGRCRLNFPSPSGPFDQIDFSEEDGNEAILSRFDQEGISVWLQVEPADADLPTLIDLVLSRYRHHPCVVGFGVDVEWHRWSRRNREGINVRDEDAAAWLSAIRSHNPDYRLFLKHWRSDMMPPTFREATLFLNDSQMFSSLNHFREEFSNWGRHFSPAEVGFQFGYPADRPLWKDLKDPAAELTRMLQSIANAREFYWVDFSMRELWPPFP